MRLRRVVITGQGAISPFGCGVEPLMEGLLAGRSAVRVLPELEGVGGLRTRVGARAAGVDPRRIERRFRRSMSPMSVFATLASEEALAQAGLGAEERGDGRTGVAIGATVGSTVTNEAFFADYFRDRSLERMKSTIFFQIMNHSCAANVAQALGITGRLLAPSAACSTGCQAVGYGYEMIAFGRQERMLCGGADEFHPLTAATFDVFNAGTTGYNDRPEGTPRPFDRDRDGVVCAEGGGVLLLEELETARRRGAPILAEVVGFATVADPESIANPNRQAMERCMSLALEDAGLEPAEVDYLNAHATATVQGDVAESEAIAALFGERVPVSSLKGHMGHTMAASGALELTATVEMLRRGVLVPTRNLERIDPACAVVNHLQGGPVEAPLEVAVKNNFALGGVNSTIIVRRYAA
ncbi:MAG: beta-ketoacyl-[acyl-carrier-protein] synthase family protein [Desulfuromonas sp.]|uniref:beta-ketoacyl-[acyl-carrier-protein] synthase family protein n=1 Tax=Desulfuromonas sp. TaxID=892 RepID=UPI000CA95B7C|nr:beta-ketoacyl synthase N-terminal-like domain-containing protein [Desulfuromonas sp.]PLX82985.1 MAG: beta-ketoacyl-[acyl-carrier-protein] synthase family protein [Desulfuromonas sp.]